MLHEYGDTHIPRDSTILKIALFFVIACLVSWLCWLPPFLNARTPEFPQPLLLFGMFATLGPLVSSLIMLSFSEGKKGVKQLFQSAWKWRFKKIWLLAVVFIPIALTGLSLAMKLVFENSQFMWGVAPSALLLTAVAIFFTGGPLEEFGWRGYALPLMLKKFNVLTASLLLGIMHALWHLPLHFITGTVQNSMPFWQFGLVTVVGAIAYTWIYLGTRGSLTTVIIYHWIGNISSALFVYWDTNLGRWLFFILQTILAVAIVIAKRKDF